MILMQTRSIALDFHVKLSIITLEISLVRDLPCL